MLTFLLISHVDFSLELPSSEPPVGRSPGTRAASLATDRRRRRRQRSSPLLVSREGSGRARQQVQAILRMRLFEVSTPAFSARASSQQSFRIKPPWLDHTPATFFRAISRQGGSAELVCGHGDRCSARHAISWGLPRGPPQRSGFRFDQIVVSKKPLAAFVRTTSGPASREPASC